MEVFGLLPPLLLLEALFVASSSATAVVVPVGSSFGTASSRTNLTGLWSSDSTLRSGPWSDRYALTEAAGTRSAAVLCVNGGIPASCANVSGGGGGAWHTAKIAVTGSHLAITFDFGLTHHGTLNANVTGISWTEDATHWRRVGSHWVPPSPSPSPSPTPAPPIPPPTPPVPPGPPRKPPTGYDLVGVANCLPNTPNMYD